MERHDIWSALSDPTRRRIIELLIERGPLRTCDLAECFDVTRFAVMKHLDHLVSVDLVKIWREGRVRWNQVNLGSLREPLAWLNGIVEQEGVGAVDVSIEVPVVWGARDGADVVSVPAPDADGRWIDPAAAARRHAAELLLHGVDDVRPSVERVTPRRRRP